MRSSETDKIIYIYINTNTGIYIYIWHSYLRNGIGAQGFQGQEGHSQDDKKSRCLVIRSFYRFHIDGTT